MLIIYWIFSALLVGVDQLVKWWITDNLALGETKSLIPGNRWFMIGLSPILAGAIGNFIDRLRLGYVVDMFQTDFMNFPIFNVADVTLVCGVICILIYIILDEKDQRKK